MQFNHPGVTLVQKVKGGAYCLRWFDPRERNKQTKPSAGTNDFTEASRIAHDHSVLIHNEDFWESPPEDLHPRATEIWGVMPIAGQAKEAIKDLSNPRRFPNRETNSLSGFSNWNYELATVTEYRKKLEGLLGKLDTYKNERDQWRQRAIRSEGLLKKMGRKIVNEQAPIALSEAIAQYLKHGTGAKGQFNDIIGMWLRRMAEELGAKKNVFEVTEEDVKEHLETFKENLNFRQMEYNIRKFLGWATKDSFVGREVLEWAKAQKKDDEPPKQWFWLTKKQVKALIVKIRELRGDYWADAAIIQYGLGLRPEELPLLQTSLINKNRNKYLVTLSSIYDGSKRVRRLKTQKSHASNLRVPSYAAKAVERRLGKKSFLLFPCNQESGHKLDWEKRAKSRKTGKMEPRFTSFERENLLWPSADDKEFSSTFREILREAAAMAELPAKNINARTLRQTCAREMILKHGLDRAAALLRDSVVTLKNHYADLLPSDINTER